MELHNLGKDDRSVPPSFSTVAVAVNGNKNSRYAVKWALEKFIPEGRSFFKLLHIRPKITLVPTPMGNYLPISKVRDDIVSAYRKEIAWKTDAMLIPYKQMCAERQVETEAVIIEADDVAEAICGEVTKFTIDKLVIGASSQSRFTRKLKGSKMSCRISGCAPSFCSVYVVRQGKLLSVRASTSGSGESAHDDQSNSSSSSSISSQACSSQSETDTYSAANISYLRSSTLSMQRDQALKTINQNLNLRSISHATHHSRNLSESSPAHTYHSGSFSLGIEEDAMSSSSSDVQCGMSTTSSYKSFQMDSQSWNSDLASTSENPTDSSPLEDQVDISFELEKMRIELRHLRGMCEMAKNETIDTSRQLHELSACHTEDNQRLKEIISREQKARVLARQEKERREAAEREAELVRVCAEKEVLQRKNAEGSAAHEVEEKQRLEKALSGSDQQYKKFTWEEILSATSSLSDILKVGAGANGTVYKGSYHHITVAVKVLHSNEGYGTKQFKQELEVLGRIRHPHLLLLLGACPERGCLVYEYMGNGSLEDRLQRKNNTPPLRWFDRFRIAWEVASALVFLHNSKPKPIVHRDLKPANILLDQNSVSKIGDVGLSTLLPTSNPSMSTMYKDTAPVGTFCYIDPEYQRTGMLSQKSDVYALGVVILQLLTAKPPMGLAHIVETALEDGSLMDVLDSSAGKWPTEETEELALWALSCAEMRRRDRPDLQAQVLPMLERLKEIADKSRDSGCQVSSVPPSHFNCPILQEVMDDPCVAADGYTYDRRAIEIWLTMNDKSPMTNLQLTDKNLIPNHTLLSAIKEWKSINQ